MPPSPERVLSLARESRELQREFFEAHAADVARAAERIEKILRDGGKILLFGNGGSAADCQHFAAELVGTFERKDRHGLAALALTTDTSALTSIANDTDFSQVFSRQIEALGRAGDIAIGISTSGASPSVLEGLKKAREMGLATMALLGRDGGPATQLADAALVVSGTSAARIQETHAVVIHVLCALIEEKIEERIEEKIGAGP